MDLNDYYYYVHVIEKKGFAPASRALGIPKSRLSRHISQLEDRLGVRLIQRTSRQFNVTDIGTVFYEHARKAVDEVEAANAAVKNNLNTLSGKIRMSCSVGMAQFALSEIAARFIKKHPNVDIIQQVTNEAVDLIEQGLDLVVRAHSAPLPDSTLIQRRLTKTEFGLFASPGYLEKVGTPLTPEHLEEHTGLKLGWKPEKGSWSLSNKDGSNFVMAFEPRLCSDDMVTLKNAASVGLGIVGLPMYTCREEIRVKQLVRVLPDWTVGVADISLLMPSRQGVAPAVNTFAAYLSDEMPKIIEM